MENNKLSRIEFLNKVSNKEIKNGTEFTVFNGEVEIGIVAVQRAIVVYVSIPHNILDLLNNDKYSFEEIQDEIAEIE